VAEVQHPGLAPRLRLCRRVWDLTEPLLCGMEGSLPLWLLQGLCRDAFGLEPAQQSAGARR